MKKDHTTNRTAKKRKKPIKTQPITNREDLAGSNDNRIDEDFPGYPHHPSTEKVIHPTNKEERKSAGLDRHNGSAGAFDASENPERWEE
jgi:hypothetical protein